MSSMWSRNETDNRDLKAQADMHEAETQVLRRRVKELETENAELRGQVAGSENAQLRVQLAAKDIQIATLENEKKQTHDMLAAKIRELGGIQE